MSLNFFIFFTYYFIILVSIVGYGSIFLSFEKKNKSKYNLGVIGLVGVFFLIVYSYLSNIFIPHSKIHNFWIILIGFLSFLYYIYKNHHKRNLKNNLFLFFLVFLVLFISLLIEKNHDDFPYYHFAYTYNLTQDSLNFGIGKLNHGFRTPSSIFYLNSLFYLPLAEYYLFNFSAAFILGFSNIILLKKVSNFFENFKMKSMEIKFSNYLALLSFIFINIFFYRISEHGTDRSAQILIFLLFIYLLEIFENKKNEKKDLFFISTLLTLIISLKSFYFLYMLLLIPLFYFLLQRNKNLSLTLKLFFTKDYSIYSTLLIILILLSYFVNTGCLLYPISFTCFENFAWSIPIDSVKKMNDWYELWSKSGANPNYRVSNPEEYIIGLNWVSNWIQNYFFNKVSDFILGLILILLIFWMITRNFKKKKKKLTINKFSKYLYLILILIFIEWFLNHPALRYGGFSVIALLIFIPFSFYLNKFNLKYSKFNQISIVLVCLTTLIFEARNLNRVINEVKIYNYKPFIETYYKIDKNYFSIQKKIDNLKNKDGPFSKTVF